MAVDVAGKAAELRGTYAMTGARSLAEVRRFELMDGMWTLAGLSVSEL